MDRLCEIKCVFNMFYFEYLEILNDYSWLFVLGRRNYKKISFFFYDFCVVF